jgi:hypothetical protein
MACSNITIRSNVFVRRERELVKDSAFISQVRGRSALMTLLRRLAPQEDPARAARRYLDRRQLAQVAWQARCSMCDGFPEGPVSHDGKVEIQFRCPMNTCNANILLPRTVLIDVEVVTRSIAILKKPFAEIVQDALRHENGTSGQFSGEEDMERKKVLVRVSVRLSLSQWHFYTDEQLESAVKTYLARTSL